MKPLPKGLPATIKIGAVDIALKNGDQIRDEVEQLTDAMGCYNHARHEIVVIFSRPAKMVAVTLLHEIFHAVWAEYDLGEREKEERAVTALSSGVAAVMRDNPDVFVWIMNRLGNAG